MTIQQLNEHPLNRAATLRLDKMGEYADPKEIHLLQLVSMGMGHPNGEPTEQYIQFVDLMLRAPKATFHILVQDLEWSPKDIEDLPLEELAEDANYALQPVPPRD